MAHVGNIKKKLGISGGAQIDLLIDRRDRVTDVCEIKFSIGEYSMTKEHAETLADKVNVFRNSVK